MKNSTAISIVGWASLALAFYVVYNLGLSLLNFPNDVAVAGGYLTLVVLAVGLVSVVFRIVNKGANDEKDSNGSTGHR